MGNREKEIARIMAWREEMSTKIALVDVETGNAVSIGDTVTDFRGHTHTLTNVFPFDGMAGKIATNDNPQLYASVINCEFRYRDTGERHYNRR